MSSLTYKLEKLEAKRKAGKRAVVKVNDVAHDFCGVMFGGVSPRVWLCGPSGAIGTFSAAEWRRLGAAL